MHRLLVLFLLPIVQSQIWYGAETVNPTTSAQYGCLLNGGAQYIFVRVGKADGSIDNVGLQNIKNAYSGRIFNHEAIFKRSYLSRELTQCRKSNRPQTAQMIKKLSYSFLCF